MSREYHITLSEEKMNFMILAIDFWIANGDGSSKKSLKIAKIMIDKLNQAKQKPYTNFDKIKDEMTIDNLAGMLGEVYPAKRPCQGDKRWCKEKCDTNDLICCEDCVKEWLESEVKE